MRTSLAATLSTVALTSGMLLGAPAAHAGTTADPVSAYSVVSGNTYTTGTITWHSRSVTIAGEHKSVSTAGPEYCRTTYAYTLDINGHELPGGENGSTSIVCGVSADFPGFTVPADVPGGAVTVRVCLDDGNYVDLVCNKFGPRPSA